MRQRDEERGEGEAEEQVEVRGGARRAEEQRGGEAEVAAGDLVLDGDQEPHRLREGPGGQRQVDRAHPQAERAEPVADRRRHHRARDDARPGSGARRADEERRGVAADARERVVGERELPGVPGEEVPAGGEDHVVERDVRTCVWYSESAHGSQPSATYAPRHQATRRTRRRHPAHAPRSESRMMSRSWSAKSSRGPSRRTSPRSIM